MYAATDTVKSEQHLRWLAINAKQAAEGRWRFVFEQLPGSPLAGFIGKANAKGSPHGPCPAHGGHDGFRLDKDWEHSGKTWGCKNCIRESLSNGITTIESILGWSNQEAVLFVADLFGLLEDKDSTYTGPPPPKINHAKLAADRKREQEVSDKRATDRLVEVFDGVLPLSDARSRPVWAYLNRRGITKFGDIQDVFFHPGIEAFAWCPVKERKISEGVHPAMVTHVRRADGRGGTAHVIFLTNDGRKAPVAVQKKLMPYPEGRYELTGGCAHIDPLSTIECVGEGIETMLKVREVMGLPVKPCINASMLGNWQWHDNCRGVLIWADNDLSQTGLNVSRKLANRCKEAGIYHRILLPPDMSSIADDKGNIDWLDVFNHYKADQVYATRWYKELRAEIDQQLKTGQGNLAVA